jgi:lipopolysaccharide biosynthesis protein
LRALDLSPTDFEPEEGQVDGTTAHAVERIIGILARESGYRLRDEPVRDDEVAPESWTHYAENAPRRPRARVVPFYLPQFHTFPENDRWWGKGFTEWTNVAGAVPLFRGHNQPLVPGELGFYDLEHNLEIRRDQYRLAQHAGIEGFMFYYYWFAGKTLMTGPIEALVKGDDDEPFCIMWANENWTRTWDGSAENILIAQDYEHVPGEQFVEDVLHLLRDPRYLRVDGKLLLAVYRIAQLPDYQNVIAKWREIVAREGLGELLVVSVDVGRAMDGIEGDLADHGVDAFLEFAPHNQRWVPQKWDGLDVDRRFNGNLMSYTAMVEHSEIKLASPVADDRFPGVMVNFDNTARRQWKPDIWYGSNPFTFRRWLAATADALAERDFERRIVFVNAWNEWAESAVLEPTQRWARTYLLAVRDAILS